MASQIIFQDDLYRFIEFYAYWAMCCFFFPVFFFQSFVNSTLTYLIFFVLQKTVGTYSSPWVQIGAAFGLNHSTEAIPATESFFKCTSYDSLLC